MMLVKCYSYVDKAYVSLQISFYLLFLLKSCNFNYSNLLLLIKNSIGIRHYNRQPSSRINCVY